MAFNSAKLAFVGGGWRSGRPHVDWQLEPNEFEVTKPRAANLGEAHSLVKADRGNLLRRRFQDESSETVLAYPRDCDPGQLGTDALPL